MMEILNPLIIIGQTFFCVYFFLQWTETKQRLESVKEHRELIESIEKRLREEIKIHENNRKQILDILLDKDED